MSRINSKKHLFLAVFLLLSAALFLVLLTNNKSQDIRKQAFGSGEVKFFLTDASGHSISNVTNKTNLEAQVMIRAEKSVTLKSFGAEISFDPAFFSPPAKVECGSSLSLSSDKINGVVFTPGNAKVKMTCLGKSGATLILNQGDTAVLGKFSLYANKATAPQTTYLRFVRAVAPMKVGEAVVDKSDMGQNIDFTISDQINPTHTPVPTATPSSTPPLVPSNTPMPTSTPVPINTPTSTPVPTIIPSSAPTPTQVLSLCQLCDIDGNGCFDTKDGTVAAGCFNQSPPSVSCQHWDVVKDGIINIYDYMECRDKCLCQ